MKLRVKLAVHFVCFSMHCFNITHGEYVVAVYVRTEFFKKKKPDLSGCKSVLKQKTFCMKRRASAPFL